MSRSANTSGYASLKYLSQAAGMPLVRHWLTALVLTIQILATSPVPPSASIIRFGFMSAILDNYPTDVKQKKLENFKITLYMSSLVS